MKDWEKRFDEKFREEPEKDNEEMYFEFYDGCVEFRKGYRGYDSFMVDLKDFLATALEEQATRHAMLMAGLEAQIEQKAVIRASELVDKARGTALEEQRKADAKIVRSHRLTDWSGEGEVYEELEEIARKIESTILNGKGE